MFSVRDKGINKKVKLISFRLVIRINISNYFNIISSSLVGMQVHRNTGARRGHGFKSRTGLNFFLVLFTTARFSSVLSCEDLLISSLYRSANMWNFHISKIFIHLDVYLYPIHWTAPSWLVSSIGRALHRFSMDKLVRLAKPVHVAVLKLIELTCLMK